MAFRGDLEALVLGVLQDRSAHGYEIARAIAERTDRLITIGEGQLYPLLHRMEKNGFVSAEWIPQEKKPAQKQYKLTPQGLLELGKQRAKWQKFSAGVSSLLAGPQSAEARHG